MNSPITNYRRTKYSDLLEHVGNTPLVEIKNITQELPKYVKIFTKLEGFNPGGSVKDRPALRMIEKGEEQGLLTPDKTILEATSGNTGIALAMIGAVKGYNVELVMPENMSEERKILLKAYGAKCTYSNPLDATDGAIIMAREIYEKNPEKYFIPGQYDNPENWKAHYHGTAEEIIRVTKGTITHFVAGVGTSGTLIGTSKRLKEFNPDIQCFGVQPSDSFHGLEGLKFIGTSIVPKIYDMAFEETTIFVKTEDAYDMVKRLAREEGLFMGISSGGAMVGAMRLAKQLKEGVIVTIFPDKGEKYFSTKLF